MLKLVEATGHEQQCPFMQRSKAEKIRLNDIPRKLMMAICLKVVCIQFGRRYADNLDISILEYFESIRGITTERQSVTKRSREDCFQ
jgi:hypothetical protein